MSGLFRPIDSDPALIAVALAALLWGIAGGFSHCLGMCGVFVLLCGKVDEPDPRRRLASQALFQVGRLITLTALGAAAGAAGSLVGLAAHTASVQGALPVASGVVLCLLALGYAGIAPRSRIPEPDILGAGGGAGRRVFARLLRGHSRWQPLGLGLMVGFLPCGLTYTILIPAAASLSAWKGALIVLAFGLGTIPGLITLGMAGHFAGGLVRNERFRIGMTRSGALIMLLTGAALIWRGWPNLVR